MNCQKFEATINDLARACVMDAALNAEMQKHAAACGRCAARLADERALSQGLRAVMEASETVETPPHIEATLRAAFRHRAAQAQGFSSYANAPLETIEGFKAKQLVPRALARQTMMAIAAALVLACLTFPARLLYAPSTEITETPTISVAQSSPQAVVSAAPAFAPSPGIQSAAPSRDFVAAQSSYSTSQANFKNASDRTGRVFVAEAMRRGERAKSTPGSAPAADAALSSAGETEIATDFLPLVDADSLTTQDGGQLVRVKLPRSALLAFGLPMNIERADEPVKADVVVGEDGLARAIRFVR
ncbi:MAG: hypothetical protein ABR577_11475 [Pyrinomonadaceae bacterium]